MKLYVWRWRWTDCTNSVHLSWLLLSIITTTITTFSESASANIVFSHEHNAFNNTDDHPPPEFSPARRTPQGFDIRDEGLQSSASYRNVLQFPIRNFTKVATIRYTNPGQNDETANKNKNTYSSIINARAINKSKPALVLTLSLKPTYSPHNTTEEPHPLEIFEQATTALISHTVNQTLLGKGPNSEGKPYNILDRLRNLSHQRLKANGGTPGPGLRFGIKNFGRSGTEDAIGDKNSSSQIKYSAGPIVKTTILSTKLVTTTDDEVGSPTISPTATPTSIPTSTGQPSNFITSSSSSPYKMPRLPPISSIISPKPRSFSTTPIVLKVGKLSQLAQNDSKTEGGEISTSTQKSADDGINTGETRVAITADQIGGNRPTSMPFHFTTAAPTPPPPSTTARKETVRINRYQQHQSPHNHAFAPTRDPVSDVNDEEDLSVEDFQDIRVANLVFGSKVGSDFSTPNPVSNQIQATPNVKSRNNKVSGKSYSPPSHSTVAVTVTTTPSPVTAPPRLLPAPTPKPAAVHSTRNRYHQHVQEDVENEINDNEEEDGDEDEYLNPLQKNFKNRPSVKIVTQAPTTPSTTKPPKIIPQKKFTPTRHNFFGRPSVSPAPSPLPIAVAPDSGSASGVNSQAALNNDNLPFYKEPGGIFKEHNNNKYGHDSSLHDDDDNDLDQDPENDASPNLNLNQVAHNSNKSPKVKYAPNNGNGGQSHHHNQHPLHHHHAQPAVYPTNNPNQFQYQAQQPVYIQPHPQQNIYFQPVPSTPFYPQAQIYPTQTAPAFVPIQHIQGYQHHPQPQGPLVSPPIYHPQQPQQPPRRQQNRSQNNQRDYDSPPPIAPRPINRDNFPSPDDPDSDTFYGDPRPDTNSKSSSSPSSKNKKNSPRPAKGNSVHNPPPVPPGRRNQQEDKKKYHQQPYRRSTPATPRRGPDDTYDIEEEEEDNRRRQEKHNANNRPKGQGQNQPERPILHQQQYPSIIHPSIRDSRPKPNRNDRIDDDETDYVDEAGHDDEDRNHNTGNGRGGGNRDYDGDFDSQRPTYDNERDRERQRGSSFKPSPVDRGPVRPSSHDFNSPNFDHPNIQYPNRGSGGGIENNPFNNQPLFNQGPEFDPRGFGVGYGPAPRANVHLDPIYTRTIKQYDEEIKKAPQQNQQQRPRPQQNRQTARNNGNRDDDHADDDHTHNENDGGRNRGGRDRERDDDHDDDRVKEEPRRRPATRDRDRDREEEEEEPPQEEEEVEEEEKPARRPPPPREQENEDEEEEEEAPPPKKKKEEEEPEAEEEEEEDEEKPEEKKKPEKEEEEEEAEEEEDEEEEETNRKRVPLGNRQRKGGDGQQGKKTEASKKPPPNEKSGDLEDDIRGIEREFNGGGILGD